MVLCLRTAALLALPITMSACVLPIAPEFQDPPASKNYAPVFLNVQPDIGSIVTVASLPFIATVTDPNVGDDLRARWIVDYPPYTSDTRTSSTMTATHTADGTPLLHDFRYAPDCIVDNLAKIQRHQVMVVVADRDFATQAQGPIDLTKLQDADGGKVIATWTLDMECK